MSRLTVHVNMMILAGVVTVFMILNGASEAYYGRQGAAAFDMALAALNATNLYVGFKRLKKLRAK